MSIQFETFDPNRRGQSVALYGSSVPGPHVTSSEIYQGSTCYTIAEPAMASRVTVSDPNTASNYDISGRVVDSADRAISRAQLALQNTNTGAIVSAVSNSFGNFKFNAQPAGNNYTLSVSAKGRTFTPNTQTFQLLNNISNLEFVGSNF